MVHAHLLVVVACWGGGLAWIADAAASRGRSQVGWTALAALISVACYPLGWFLVSTLLASPLSALSDVAAPVLGVLAPLVLVFCALLGLGLWLKRQPVKVRTARVWPVSCRTHGAGKLESPPDTVRMVWEDRTQDVPRAQLSSIRRDGECLRLVWTDGELMLMPMLHPQTRDGRISQSETLARLLAPVLPTAIQVNRRSP
ncbi:MAG TPA: hypothetical protein VF469_08775 [Kofleriaceae bacterium]